MASSPTDLYLPQTFPFPIKVVSIDANTTSSIRRGTRLLSYSFVYLSPAPDAKPETRFGTWDAALEGTIDKWNLKPGDVISSRKAKDKPALAVVEPCKHGMQLGGLCVLCGKDMTNTDYTGFSDASRASIQMTHSAFGPTVSLEEAQRIERETAEHLLKSRKLSLIVDLDQTIVHATVDPTVGEWIGEGEAWEKRQAENASSSKDAEVFPDHPSGAPEDDECNPNWEALKDVKRFRLGPESLGMTPRRRPREKIKMLENEGCMYYIKPRPGWKEFLQQTAARYEMHVYTMGTRAYAEEVCAAIDPDGKIFGGRILSRDESGSLTQKSLQRLFPCDTSMVVIIDDRADVWEWSPNLIKVIPYDFFVGIGDINSAFLPKVEPISPLTAVPGPHVAQPPGSVNVAPQAASGSGILTMASAPSNAAEGISEEDVAALQKKAMLTQNSLALEAQFEERPLAKKQEKLQEEEKSSVDQLEAATVQPKQPTQGAEAENTPSLQKQEKHHRRPLLKNDDCELQRVFKLLDEVHTRFFTTYDSYAFRFPDGEPASKPGKVPYDVTRIIPRIRSEVLEGVHILFSSVIPLDTKPETTEVWKMAHMFGAKCSTELSSDITHVVAAKRGTVKVDAARKRGGIKIVWLAWFTDCVALWRHQDETPYLLDEPPSVGSTSSPTTDLHNISSDPEPDGDDWDQEPLDGKDMSPLKLADINWNDINDEVEAAMNESDDDDEGRSERIRSGNASEDDWTDETNSVVSSVTSTPRLKRKRLRSVTPSEGATAANGGYGGDDHGLRSPLAKRKKLAADRMGQSRLKEGTTAEELTAAMEQTTDSSRVASHASTTEATDAADGESEDEEEEEEDDFLARELEEEWG